MKKLIIIFILLFGFNSVAQSIHNQGVIIKGLQPSAAADTLYLTSDLNGNIKAIEEEDFKIRLGVSEIGGDAYLANNQIFIGLNQFWNNQGIQVFHSTGNNAGNGGTYTIGMGDGWTSSWTGTSSDVRFTVGSTSANYIFNKNGLTNNDDVVRKKDIDGVYEINIGNPPIDGYVYSSSAAGTRSWIPPASGGGGGDVSQFGTVLNNQLAVWTGTGLIEGDSDLTFDGTNLLVTGTVAGSNITTIESNITTINEEQNIQDAAIALNTAKTTNTNHTGDVTGATVLTIATDAVDISMLSATGTPSSNSFLRGDNQWATPAGSGNVSTSGSPIDNDFAKFVNATDIEGRSYSEVRSDLGLVIGANVQAWSSALDAVSGTNTGNQTSIVGITGTKSQFNTAVTDGNFLYVGDITGNVTHTGDVTGATTLTIGANKVLESHLKAVDSPNDEEILTYEATTGDFEWQPNYTGDITGVNAGNGLTGGGSGGTVTLNVGAGTGISVAADAISATLGTAITGVELQSTNTRADNLVPSYDNATGGFTWISAGTGDITGVTAGTGLAGGGSSGSVTLSLNFAELTDMTAGITGATEFILQNGTTESRKRADEISLSNFNNNLNWTSNTGDIIGVTAGNGLTGGATSGTATLNVGAGTGISVSADAIAATLGTSITSGEIVNGTIQGVDLKSTNSLVNNYIPQWDSATDGFTWVSDARGTVLKTGTPVNDQIAVWTSSTTLEGTTGLTYSSSTLNVGGTGDGAIRLQESSDTDYVTLKADGTTAQLEIYSMKAGASTLAMDIGQGSITAPNLSNAEIISAGDPSLLTKGYADTYYAPISAASGLNNIVEDLTPQLGGNLDMNDKAITGNGVSITFDDLPTSNLYTEIDVAGGGTSVKIATGANYDGFVDRHSWGLSAYVYPYSYPGDYAGGIGFSRDESDGKVTGSVSADEFSMGEAVLTNYRLEVEEQSVSYDVTGAEYGKIIYSNSSSAVIYTLPSTLNAQSGDFITFIRNGNGAVTIQAGNSVVLNGIIQGSTAISARYKEITIKCLISGSDYWIATESN